MSKIVSIYKGGEGSKKTDTQDGHPPPLFFDKNALCNTNMDAIIDRTDLLSLRAFAAIVDADVRTVQRVIDRRELDCEVISDGDKRRIYVNIDRLADRARAQGLTVVGMFKRLARLCRK